MLFHCVVMGKPIPQGRMRHTATGGGYYSASSSAHRRLLVAAFVAERPRWGRPGWQAIEDPSVVHIAIAGAHGSTDLDNHAKQACDALVRAGILAKDSIMVLRELVVRVVDGPARTVVSVSRWTGA